MEDLMLDEEGNFVAAADGDAETVTEIDCLAQDVKHLLLTYPGDLWTDEEYGAGLQQFIQAEDTDLNRLEIEQVVKLAIAEDDRVDPESIKVLIMSWERDRIKLAVSIWPKLGYEEDDNLEEAAIVLTITQEGIMFEE